MYRVLIADDEPSVLEGLKLMIQWEKLGFMVCAECADGQEALEKLRQYRPHLVITDIQMPIQTGLDFITETKKEALETIFVILSGYPDFQYIQKAIQHHVHNYLLKPLDQEEIIAVIQDIRKELDQRFFADYGFAPIEIEAYQSQNNTTFFEESRGVTTEGFTERAKRQESFISAIRLMQREEAHVHIDELFELLEKEKFNTMQINMVINSCLYDMIVIAADRHMKLDAFLFHSYKKSQGNHLLQKDYVKKVSNYMIEMLEKSSKRQAQLFLHEVKEYIEKHFEEHISIGSLAEMAHVDPVYLGNAFRSKFGCTIKEYQHKLRMEKAILLIQQTELPLHEIALLVGYNHYNNFFTYFEKITHKRPAEYRSIVSHASKKTE